MSDENKTIIVLGGGVGGVVVATLMRKKLPKEHRVVLIDREERHVFAPSLLWLMTGERRAEKISRPLERLSKKGIEVVHGEIDGIDARARTVTVGGTSMTADYLVISLGAELAPDLIPGLAPAGHDLYSLAGAERLRDALHAFRSGRLVVLTASPAYKCPAAPYEAAMLLEYDCRKRKIRDAVGIDLYAAEPGPMGVAGADVTAAVRQMVEKKGIGYYPAHQVTEVDAKSNTIAFANGATAPFDLLAYVPPHRAPRVVREAELTDDSGWVPVDRLTLQTEIDGVFAIGDVTGIPLAMGKPLPKAGVFAHGQAEVVANNIVHDVTGRGKPKTFDGHGECFIEAGDGKAGFGRGNFYAEPTPQVKLHDVGRAWHAAKVLFEKDWLRRWF
ncbi:MAG: FAD/NAD(P)-binding oxidoreductase [Polyangiaceae bacterium]